MKSNGGTAWLTVALATLLVTYQIPDARVAIGGVALPFAVAPVAMVYLVLLRNVVKLAIGRIFLLAVTVLTVAVLLSAIGTDADASEVAKAAIYPMSGAAIAAYLRLRGHQLLFAASFGASALIVTLYGIGRLLAGEGEANLFYVGVHYTMSTRNSDGLFFAAASVAAAAVCAAGQRRLQTWAMLTCWAVCSTATVLTFARSAWIAYAFATGVFFVLYPFKSKLIVPALVSTLLALVLSTALSQDLGQAAADRALTLIGSGESSNEERLAIIDAALSVIGTRPLLGVGPGQFSASLGYAVLSPFRHTENAYLNYAVESGVVAGLAFAVIVVLPLFGYRRAQPHLRTLGVTLGTFLLVEFLFVTETSSLLVWSVIGLVNSLDA